jgi:hypothetical protein
LAFNDDLAFVAVFLPLVADAFFPLERALEPDLVFEPALPFRVDLDFGDLDFDTVFLPFVADVFFPFAGVLALEPVLALDAVFLPLVAEVFRPFETALDFKPALLFVVLPLAVTLFFAPAFVFKDDLALEVLPLDATLLPLEVAVFLPFATALPLLFAAVLPLAVLVFEPAFTAFLDAALFFEAALLLVPALALDREFFALDADLVFGFLAFDASPLFLVEALPFAVLLFNAFLFLEPALVLDVALFLKPFLREAALLLEASLPLEAALDLELVLPFCVNLDAFLEVLAFDAALLFTAFLVVALVLRADLEFCVLGERDLDLVWESFALAPLFALSRDFLPSTFAAFLFEPPRPKPGSSSEWPPDPLPDATDWLAGALAWAAAASCFSLLTFL